MNKKTLFLGVTSLVILILILLLFWVNRSTAVSQPVQNTGELATIKGLPDFRLIDSNQSKEVTRSDVVGEKMLLNVWATWCVACRQEHTFLHDLEKLGIRIVGLNFRDRPQLVNTWFKELGNPYQVNLLDVSGSLGEQLPVIGAPETYFIDSTGAIQYKHAGIISQSHWDAGLSKIYEQMK